jgi:hypothetical protein
LGVAATAVPQHFWGANSTLRSLHSAAVQKPVLPNLGAVQGVIVFRSVSKIFEIVKPAGTAHLWWGMKDLRSYFSSTANTYGLVKACKLGKQSLQGPSVRSKHPENQPEKRTLCLGVDPSSGKTDKIKAAFFGGNAPNIAWKAVLVTATD